MLWGDLLLNGNKNSEKLYLSIINMKFVFPNCLIFNRVEKLKNALNKISDMSFRGGEFAWEMTC